jgi:hypothetical protein
MNDRINNKRKIKGNGIFYARKENYAFNKVRRYQENIVKTLSFIFWKEKKDCI